MDTGSLAVIVVWALLTVISNVAAQLFLKIGVRLQGFELASISINPLTLTSAGLYGFGLIFWAKALQTLPLSAAYPLMAAVLVAVPALSVAFLSETLSWMQILGLIVIIAGVSIFFVASIYREAI